MDEKWCNHPVGGWKVVWPTSQWMTTLMWHPIWMMLDDAGRARSCAWWVEDKSEAWWQLVTGSYVGLRRHASLLESAGQHTQHNVGLRRHASFLGRARRHTQHNGHGWWDHSMTLKVYGGRFNNFWKFAGSTDTFWSFIIANV
jgi:hypothetical protein